MPRNFCTVAQRQRKKGDGLTRKQKKPRTWMETWTEIPLLGSERHKEPLKNKPKGIPKSTALIKYLFPTCSDRRTG